MALVIAANASPLGTTVERFNCTHRPAVQHSCPESKQRRHLDKPFRWLHVPKSGESFASVLVPLACPQALVPPGAACALAATFWASTLRSSSFSRLVQDVRRGEGRSPVANASAAVRLVGTLPRCEKGCRRTRANNNCSAGRRDY